MNNLAKSLATAAAGIAAIATPLLDLAVLGLILVAIAAQLGFPQRFARVLAPTELAYLAGAYWLWRKAR